MIRYAKLSLPFDLSAMQNELLPIQKEWQAHFNTLHYEGLWAVLALRSPGGEDKNIAPELMAHAKYQDTVHMQLFPSVKKLLSIINCTVMSVRFLNLQAGAVIKQHRDNELAFEKGEARLHFPIITNPGVEFYIEDERIFLQEGECWYINANLPHKVLNNGLANRIHLVVDCKVNEWLKEMIALSSKISFKEDCPSTDLIMIIKELRLQNTETSHAIALELEQKLQEVTKKNDLVENSGQNE